MSTIKIKQKFDGHVYKYPDTDEVFDKYRHSTEHEYAHIPVEYDGVDAVSVKVEIEFRVVTHFRIIPIGPAWP